MSEYDEFESEDTYDPSDEDASPIIPDPVPDEVTESEAGESEGAGVVWTRGKNGKLERS